MTMKTEDIKQKPPLGIKPRWTHETERLIELFEAIIRYISVGKKVPESWCSEINDLLWNFVE